MSKPLAKKEKDNALGVKVEGSASEGHAVKLSGHDALKTIFGTKSQEQAAALLSHCFSVLNRSEAGEGSEAEDERMFMLSTVDDIAPRDAVERLLAVQMAATHVATIRSARWLANSDQLEQAQVHFNGYNKLARTFTAQVEALRKHRNGGKQTVTVQHVNVEEGGQAIVGNVQQGGEGKDGK
ncbi:hypothetical protein PH7735_03236 [Shimia thalassica]|uniref:Uncharacterized protein n=1 Tax=Shimia thalassica TaxID=1715693 RepID=A0A0P1IEL0_9RHOB|nr:hypothetical protein [Shimia thalassica]CUK08370.1 hypothetical protein PH7735_03236 [Shimia thalassica]